MLQQPPTSQALSLPSSQDDTQPHRRRQDCYERLIVPSQRPISDSRQPSQQTAIHAFDGIHVLNPSKRAAADQAWDRAVTGNGSCSLMMCLLLFNIIFRQWYFKFSFTFCACYCGCIAYLQKMWQQAGRFRLKGKLYVMHVVILADVYWNRGNSYCDTV
jgi:hypothetical protein